MFLCARERYVQLHVTAALSLAKKSPSLLNKRNYYLHTKKILNNDLNDLQTIKRNNNKINIFFSSIPQIMPVPVAVRSKA